MSNSAKYRILRYALLFALFAVLTSLPVGASIPPLQAPGQTGPQGFTCPSGLSCILIGPSAVPFTTAYSNSYFAPISGPAGIGTSDISQTTQVAQYNNVTAAWLITCPQAPAPVMASSPQYFYTGSAPFIAGDTCIANPSPPLTSNIWVFAAIEWSPTQLAKVNTYGGANSLAMASTTSLNYSPSVDGNVANGYSLKSNIFAQVPSVNQQGIWTWYAKYANMQNAPPGGVTLTQTSPGCCVYEQTQSGTVTNPDGTTSTVTWTCTYPYSVSATVTASNFANANIPYYYSKGSFGADILPFLLYNYNLSVPSEPAPLDLNMTYDVYGPLNYPNPANNIDPFPINTSSYLFATYNGMLTPFYLYSASLRYNYLQANLLSMSPIINGLFGVSVTSTQSGSTTGHTYAYPVGQGCTIERTDQGKDWGGNCPEYALGAGTIVNVYNSGWPGGTFIALALDNPPDSTHTMVYYSEDVNPSVSVGEHVTAGQVIGNVNGGPDGTEVGWAAPSAVGESLNTAEYGTYSGSGCTPEGINFVDFINKLATNPTPDCSSTAVPGEAYGNPGGPFPSTGGGNSGAGGAPPGGSSSATCPDTTNAGTLSFDQVVACAKGAHFSGVQLAIMVSISWYESSFNSNDCSGLLGNNLCGIPVASTDNQGSNSAYWYNPSSCPTGATNWVNNPTCEFAWAYDQVQAYSNDGPANDPSLCSNGPDSGYRGLTPPAGPHVFCYWGTYRNDQPEGGTGPADYCGAMPSSYSGENCPAGSAGSAGLGWDWASVGLANPGTGYGSGGGGVTSSTASSDIISFNAISLATTPNNYLFALTNSIGSSQAGTSTSPGAASSSSTYYVYVLRNVPLGFYNTSNSMQAPTVVPSPEPGSQWSTSWQNYWAQIEQLQSANVYVIEQLPINTGGLFQKSFCTGGTGASCSGGTTFTSIMNNGFIPVNLSVDNYGNVYILGYDQVTATEGGSSSICGGSGGGDNGNQYSIPAIVEIGNTLNGNPVYRGSYLSAGQMIGCNYGFANLMYDEIAVSPTGDQIYLATPTNGTIAVYDSNSLTPEATIDLAFGDYAGASSAGASTGIGSYVNGAPLVGTPTLSIFQWLCNGGLDGVGATSVPGCSQSNTNIKNDGTLQSLLGPNNNGYVDPSSGLDNIDYHHPLAIQDVGGYLYVLDDWNDGPGPYGACLLGESECHPGIFGASGSGVWFQMLDLRVLNSSGADAPVNPVYFNDIYTYNGEGKNPTQFVDANIIAYPPYGWILSANISSEGCAAGSSCSAVTFCGSTACTYNPQSPAAGGQVSGYQGVSTFGGDYPPLAPELLNYQQSGNQDPGCCGHGNSHDNGFPTITGIGFSATWDSYVTLLFPSPSNYQGSAGCSSCSGGAALPIATTTNELILSNFNPENYTSYSSVYPPSFCYSGDPKIVAGVGDTCLLSPQVGGMLPPIAPIVNPLQLLENSGSLKAISIPGFLGPTSGTAQNSQTGQSGYSQNKQCANSISNQAGGGNLPPPSSCGNQPANLNALSGSGYAGSTVHAATNAGGAISTSLLSSNVIGYVVTPYSYTLSSSYTLSPDGPGSSSVQGQSCDSSVVSSASGTSNQQLYAYNVTPVTAASYNAVVQSGSTYLEYQNNGQYYVPSLSDSNVIVPFALLFNIQTNRVFGSIILNVTQNDQTNAQLILDAVKWLHYNQEEFTQGTGSYPAYQTIKSVATTPAQLGPQAAPSQLANAGNSQSGLNAAFGYEQILNPVSVGLFDWYEGFIYNNPLQFVINNSAYSSGGQQNLQGYQRFIYIMNDKFNNTLYAPIDADVARVTNIGLTVVPTVSEGNANQTMLQINGTAGTTNVYGNFIPLTNSPIYIYYDANLNYMYKGQKATPEQASLCAFSNNGQITKDCAIANPLSSNPVEAEVADTYNYAPSYNSLGSCSPSPNSLLEPPNLKCNIYGNDGNPSDKQLPKACGASGGSTQYCVPLYSNGTGICTSQVGSISSTGTPEGSAVTTNSMGGFTVAVPACGTGSITLYAQYYGWPPPEPITANQATLAGASTMFSGSNTCTGKVQNEYCTTFPVYNYYWTPNVTAISSQIGLLVLSYGNITVAAIVVAIGLAVFVAFAVSRHSKMRKKANKLDNS